MADSYGGAEWAKSQDRDAETVRCDYCHEEVRARGVKDPEWVHVTGSVFCMTTVATVNGSNDPLHNDGSES